MNFKSITTPLIYLGVLTGLVFVFFSLHYLGNKLPVESAKYQIEKAFDDDNLSQSRYPMKKFGSNSIRTLIGQDQHTECQSLQAMLHPGDGSVREAVILLKNTVYGKNHCEAVYEIVHGISEAETEQVRTRYWWGWVAIYSILLNVFNIFQLVLGIKILTYFSFMILGIAAYAHSKRMLVSLSPLIFYGFFFSGIPYYGGVTFSLSFLWSVIALGFLVGLTSRDIPRSVYPLLFFIYGIVSSFLSSFDGHLMLLIPYSLAVLYIGLEDKNNYTAQNRITLSIHCLALFLTGFAGSLLFNQLVKSYYIGWDGIYESFQSGLSQRLSTTAYGKEIDPYKVVEKLFRRGFGTVGCFKIKWLYTFLVQSAIYAGVGALIIVSALCVKTRSLRSFIPGLFFICLIGMVFIRILVFQNHSAIHTAFIGRYMFVPLSLLWMIMFYYLYSVFQNKTK